MVDYWPAIYKHSLFTLSATLVGFGLAVGFGLLLGLAVGWSRAIYAGLYPLMIGFNAIPRSPSCRSWCCGSASASCRRCSPHS
jgi:NitT/TauT family transport system permease protein